MSKKLAIRGHSIRGEEVIKLLEMFGGSNMYHHNGEANAYSYYISNNVILHDRLSIAEDDDFEIFTLEDFLEKYPFKVGDKVYTKSNAEGTIIDMFWDGIEVLYQLSSESVNALGYFHRNELKSYKEGVNMNENKVKGYCTKAPEKCNETKKIAWFKFWDDDFADKVELDLNDRELIQENGKWFVVKKKPKYPTTYAECCEVLVGRKPNPNEISFDKMELCLVDLDNTQNIDFQNPYLFQLNSLFRLRMCRDAYWKIAGEELELGKPWKPKFGKYIHYNINFYLYKDSFVLHKGEYHSPDNRILVFPTEEMRDVFYENFKDLIEQCKELL